MATYAWWLTALLVIDRQSSQQNSKTLNPQKVKMVCSGSSAVLYFSTEIMARKSIRMFKRLIIMGYFVPGPPIRVCNLRGSLFQWATEGRSMIDANCQPTKFVHPYNAIWGKLVDSHLRKSHIWYLNILFTVIIARYFDDYSGSTYRESDLPHRLCKVYFLTASAVISNSWKLDTNIAFCIKCTMEVEWWSLLVPKWRYIH